MVQICTAEYLAINPMAKSLRLLMEMLLSLKTAAICLYLADKFIEKV